MVWAGLKFLISQSEGQTSPVYSGTMISESQTTKAAGSHQVGKGFLLLVADETLSNRD
jgi:hypothetical protein